MKIALDESIWGGEGLFAPLGEVTTFAGRDIAAAQIASADALIVRSVTRVDERLLAGSRVRFVGTASSGTDHVDLDYLTSRGIAFADAAGCNSRTVAEYVLASLLLLAERGGLELAGKVLGIIGVGRIGSLVAEWGRSLGMQVLLCDPPLARAGVDGPYVSVDRIAAEADVISLHVPLIRGGSDATMGMIDAGWLARTKRGAILINTSRGEVVDEDALVQAVESGRLGPLVIDVWNGEPLINARLVQAAAIATPHIAGYSLEAQKRAAMMIRDRLGEFLGQKVGQAESSGQTADAPPAISSGEPFKGILDSTGIVPADRALRDWIVAGGVCEGFDALRAVCRRRREFTAYRVSVIPSAPEPERLLRIWGFQVN